MEEIAVLENCKEILLRSSCEKKVPVDYFEKNLSARTLLFFQFLTYFGDQNLDLENFFRDKFSRLIPGNPQYLQQWQITTLIQNQVIFKGNFHVRSVRPHKFEEEMAIFSCFLAPVSFQKSLTPSKSCALEIQEVSSQCYPLTVWKKEKHTPSHLENFV